MPPWVLSGTLALPAAGHLGEGGTAPVLAAGLAAPRFPQTLQMGISHFSGLFVLLCLGLGSALLSSLGEHVFFHLVLPRIRRSPRLQYWLHTSQVRWQCGWGGLSCPVLRAISTLCLPSENPPSTQRRAAGGTRGAAGACAQVSLARATPAPRGGRPVQPLCPVPSDPTEPQPETPAESEGTGRWKRVRRAVGKERRVRFLLDAAPEPEAQGLTWPCSNGRLPTAMPTGAPRPGELQELERHIEGVRERLRQALVRRGDLLAQLKEGAGHRPLRLLQAREPPAPAP